MSFDQPVIVRYMKSNSFRSDLIQFVNDEYGNLGKVAKIPYWPRHPKVILNASRQAGVTQSQRMLAKKNLILLDFASVLGGTKDAASRTDPIRAFLGRRRSPFPG